ncbi:MAG: conjugal transfer protein TraF [Treponema sp.]|jgi:hypothetical protein|nr:conjugal transfer protein TraF [Treponema sp.]
MKKKATLCLCFILICAAAVFADEKKAMPRIEMPTARSSGMGGSHVAYTDNVFALLVNPAAIMRVEQRSIFALSPTLLNPQKTFKLLGPFQDAASGEVSKLGSAMDALSGGKVPLGFDIRELPLAIAWVSDGFGFGLWSRVFVNPNIIGTYVEINAYADVFLPVGFAFKILDMDSHTVDVGVTVKPFLRVKTTNAAVDIMELMDNDYDFLEDITAPLIGGMGFDLGFMYRWDAGLSAGITFSDIYTRGRVLQNILGTDTNSYYVPFSLNLGAAYDFKIGQFWENAPSFLAGTGITAAVDWKDFTNVFRQTDYLNQRNAWLNLGIGLQITMLDMIMVRAGMNDMLPAVGVGLDFGPMELDLAYYGKELGLEPGQLPAAAVDLTLAIRPGAKKRNWPWAQRSVAGLIAKSDNL